MARHRITKQNRRSRSAKARRRGVVGLGTSAGAFLAFGLTPLAAAPAAHADEVDLVLEPIINSLASVDPTVGADLSGWLANLDSVFAAASSVDASAVPAADPSLAALYGSCIWRVTPLTSSGLPARPSWAT
jgi:hypothetical protein